MTAITRSDITTLCPKVQELLQNVNGVLVGQERASRLAVVALLAGGHVILEDVPGVGKTLLAKTLAHSIEAVFKRIQCTPDLLPSDVSGVSVFEQREGTFRFIPGPIFCNILLCDEINRATPRTQSSLLEAMEEGQVTTDGTTRKLSDLFFVMATQNPIEQHGTFPLPEAQLDRFSISISMGYPKPQEETTILKKTLQEGGFLVQPVLSLEEVMEAKQAVKRVFVHDTLLNYIVEIVNATRQHPGVTLGVSPRGSQLIMRAAQASAFIDGRDYVQPEDIKAVAPFTLGHRIIPKIRTNKISHAELIEKILDTISVPS
ncbi:MAG TPA: MoxR family ATPase [Planktothrix sp.]